MRAENSKLTELKAVGVDMESAIYQGFKSIFEELSRFLIYCKLTFTLGKHTHTHTHTHRPPCIVLIVSSEEKPVQMFELNLRQFLPKPCQDVKDTVGKR